MQNIARTCQITDAATHLFHARVHMADSGRAKGAGGCLRGAAERGARGRGGVHLGCFLGVGTLPMQAPARRPTNCGARCRRSVCAACRSAPMSTVATSTIRHWNPSGRPPMSLAPSCCSIRTGTIIPGDRLAFYYRRNFVGLPFETTIAGASLVFGGMLERFPNAKVRLCHAGGFVVPGRALRACRERAAGGAPAAKRAGRSLARPAPFGPLKRRPAEQPGACLSLALSSDR